MAKYMPLGSFTRIVIIQGQRDAEYLLPDKWSLLYARHNQRKN